MKRTFDQLFAEIVGENIMAPTQQTQPQTQQPTQPQTQQPTNTPTQQQSPDIKKLSAELAGITDAAQIEKVLAGLLNPNAANKQA